MNANRTQPERLPSSPRLQTKISLSLAAFFLFAAIPAPLRADADTWDKLIRSADKAFRSATDEKYRSSFSAYFANTTPQSKGKFAQSEKDYRAALAEAKTFPAGDRRLPDTMVALAWVLAEQGNLTDAEDLVTQAVAAVEATRPSGAQSADTWLARNLTTLALFYSFDSKCDQAAPLWDRSLALLQNSPGGIPGWIENVTRRYRAHEGFFCESQVDEYVLKLKESKGTPPSELRQALVDLARAQRGIDAEKSWLRILQFDQKLYEPDQQSTLHDLEQLADVYATEGRYAAALPILLHLQGERQESQIEKADLAQQVDQYALLRLHRAKLVQSFYNSHSRYLNRKLAQAYAETGKFSEAEQLFKQLISEYETGPSPNMVMKYHDLSEDWMSLASLYGKHHRFTEAQDALNQAAKNQEIYDDSKFGRLHTEYDGVSVWAWILQNLRAELDLEQGDLTSAEPLFLRSIEMAEAETKTKNATLPPSAMSRFPDFLRLLDNYATLLRDQGKYPVSEAFYKRALDGWAKRQHPDAAHTLMNYASLLRTLNRPTEAEPLEAQAAAILAQASAPCPLDLASPSPQDIIPH